MSQSWPSLAGPDDVSLVKLTDRFDALRSSFAGTARPSSPVAGQVFYDTDSGPIMEICTNATGPVWAGLATVLGDNTIALGKLATMATDSILGRATAGTGAVEVLTALPFAYTGDVTKPADSNALTIANNAVTLAKMATMAADGILGRATAGTGNVEVLTSLPFAFTGDVTRAADSNAQTIANDAVTYAKMQNISATQRVLGRNTAGAGDTEEVTASQLMDWITSTRGAVFYRGASGWAGLAPSATVGHVFKSAGTGADPVYGTLVAASFADNTVAPARLTFAATQRLAARNTAGAGAGEEVSISGALDWLGATQGQILYRGASGWVVLAVGTAGQLLQSGGPAANPSWTAASSGPAQATQAAIEAETNEDTYVPPDLIHKSPGVSKFWAYVTVSGGVPSISVSFNLSSVTDGGSGVLTANFTTAMSSANFVAGGGNETVSGTDDDVQIVGGTRATGSIQYRNRDFGGSTLDDPEGWNLWGFGDQ